MTIIFNGNVTFNGDVTFPNENKQNAYWDHYEKIDMVKRELIDTLFDKRFCAKWGGHNAWRKMMTMYHNGEYDKLRKYIETFNNSSRKAKALKNLDIIIKDEELFWQRNTAQN